MFQQILKFLSLCSIIFFSTIVWSDNLFYDGFESGDLSHTENGVSYAGSTYTSVSMEKPQSGSYSLRFSFVGRADGEDAFAEQRMKYSQTGELWIQYDLYIPDNYSHRTQNGAANNKFLAVYKSDYRYPGFNINWSLSPNGNGGSNLSLHRFRNGSEQPSISPSGGLGENFLSAADRGNWVSIIARIKAPSNESAYDGVMQMWKNGNLVCDETELNNYGGTDENYMDELYLLGWSNSGYDEDTVFYIDNIKINNKPFVRPNPPTGVVVN
ncbi:heparin lyase I family protein [Aliikangiella sp. IMCC44359]|uniref:heparin lyase I family protein n=1 Tax=Aliikangiella sp. IMCC44359 TaxID=3459125 RepID=UPI00403A998E